MLRRPMDYYIFVLTVERKTIKKNPRFFSLIINYAGITIVLLLLYSQLTVPGSLISKHLHFKHC